MNESDREIPHPPYDELRASLGDDRAGHAALDDLHAALHADAPRSERISAPIAHLRTIPAIEARIANWFDAPRTQQWLLLLNEAGL